MAANFMPPPATVHQAVQPLAFLLGTWRGQGEGRFPTISPFAYSEELNFSHSPNKTWKLNTNQPMHAESGYWRPQIDGTIEVVIAQSTGLAEVQKGTFDAEQRIVKLKSALVGNASKVKQITRVFKVGNEELSYVVEMATNLNDLQPHLEASLKKI
ncbi:UPF0678 fatty acid-binding protein-like protein At1g79260 isoform X2 [Olea europaea var. sylvestris]|uniref:UPF0678 fatty acid-binding protein-like protein At1g79260 isoform X2 n=1 Tax=Olea europaea var. sylvestris TaxID=158386 RepID=UPI000C1D5A72|nr:UPF0678 fatty acid-binding protein-like protein At1g79260 isoform X2 [Olea europaea var. sylvestris]